MDKDEKQIGLFDEADKKLAERFRIEKPNPIDTAKDMKKAMEEYGLTQEELAARIGKSRSAVANTLRLLTLSPEIIRFVSLGRLSAGHARALVTLPQKEQETVASVVLRKRLSVRDTEKLVKNKSVGAAAQANFIKQSPELRDMIRRMQRDFGTKVTLSGTDDGGKITIEYYSRDDLERFCEILNKIEDYPEF